ncbi:3-dehydroquinate synthase [Oligella sp. HMSC09E12]|nr:3-dehydroquinate synthase [Oligella sp. HMSC09E12]
MSIVRVNVPGGSYPIEIAPNLMQQLATSIPPDTSAILLLSNPTVRQLYGDTALKALKASGKEIYCFDIPDGEQYKNLDTLNEVFTFMLEHKLDRKSVLVALGGGVVGDLGGFAAATFMRGIRFVQVPTTLLAQVDSSVGGKTAVNHPLGKNLLGAFYQPIAVDIDINVLKSLPQREIAAGLAEVIKYGLIMDREFFDWCEEFVEELKALEPQAINYAIHRACELKAQVVEEDEKESNRRMILNFGHTFAHVIENGLGYGEWLHGEAVGCGMVQAAELSALVCNFPQEDVERVRRLVAQIGCPTVAPALGGKDTWFDTMKLDKKASGGKIKFVLLEKIGQAKVQGAPQELVGLVLSKTTSAEVKAKEVRSESAAEPVSEPSGRPLKETAVTTTLEPAAPFSTVVDSSEAAAEVARQAQIARDAGAGTGRTGGIYGVDGVRPATDE